MSDLILYEEYVYLAQVFAGRTEDIPHLRLVAERNLESVGNLGIHRGSLP